MIAMCPRIKAYQSRMPVISPWPGLL